MADQAVHVHPQHGLDRDVPHFVEGGVVLVVVDAEKELADGGKLPAPVPQMNLLGSVRVLLVPPLHLQRRTKKNERRSKNEEARTKQERKEKERKENERRGEYSVTCVVCGKHLARGVPYHHVVRGAVDKLGGQRRGCHGRRVLERERE